MELPYTLRVTWVLLLAAVSSLPEGLVTSSPLLAELCPAFCFSCDVSEVLLLMKISRPVWKLLVLYRGFGGFSSCFVDKDRWALPSALFGGAGATHWAVLWAMRRAAQHRTVVTVIPQPHSISSQFSAVSSLLWKSGLWSAGHTSVSQSWVKVLVLLTLTFLESFLGR